MSFLNFQSEEGDFESISVFLLDHDGSHIQDIWHLDASWSEDEPSWEEGIVPIKLDQMSEDFEYQVSSSNI